MGSLKKMSMWLNQKDSLIHTFWISERELTQYLLSHGFTKGKADRTLFIKREDDELIVAQVYVDDIIFGSTKDELLIVSQNSCKASLR